MLRIVCSLIHLVFLTLGIHAAYTGNMPVALFFAIIFGAESIAVSIDHWPRLNTKIKLEALKG